jgi:hypothetical protein
MKNKKFKKKSFDILTFETLDANGNILKGGFSTSYSGGCGWPDIEVNFAAGCHCTNSGCNSVAGCACKPTTTTAS